MQTTQDNIKLGYITIKKNSMTSHIFHIQYAFNWNIKYSLQQITKLTFKEKNLHRL